MRKSVVVALLVISTACSSKSVIAPSANQETPATTSGQSMSSLSSLVANTVWVGTSTTNNATTGHSGSARVTFTNGGPAGDVAATIAWTLAGSSTTFNGTASGTPAAITLTAPANQTHGCAAYQAVGAINGNVFSGSYSATCHHASDAIQGDSGTFTLTRVDTPAPPMVDVDTTFCHVPPGNPAQAVTLTLPLSAVAGGHIPHHPLDHLGACTGHEGQQ